MKRKKSKSVCENKPYSKNKIKWNPQEQLCGEKEEDGENMKGKRVKKLLMYFQLKS